MNNVFFIILYFVAVGKTGPVFDSSIVLSTEPRLSAHTFRAPPPCPAASSFPGPDPRRPPAASCIINFLYNVMFLLHPQFQFYIVWWIFYNYCVHRSPSPTVFTNGEGDASRRKGGQTASGVSHDGEYPILSIPYFQTYNERAKNTPAVPLGAATEKKRG